MFSGKTVLVTGGGSGIGAATAKAFAAQGASIAVGDINLAAAERVTRQITDDGGTAIAIHVDVASTDSVETMVSALKERFGRLDVAVNNAGIGGSDELLADVPEAHFDRVLSVNLKGVWQCMRHEIPLMLHGGGGAIINMSSALGLVAAANSSEYIATKHGVIGLTKAAAIEYSAQGIRINAVCPGVIETPLIQSRMDVDASIRARLVARHPIGRLGRAEEIADAIIWLASPRSGFVNGVALPIDGGWTAH